MFEMLQYPFMQRALLGGAVIAFLLAIMGIFVLMRQMAFLGEGIAHASLAGIAIGVLTAQAPLLFALLYSILFICLLYILERKTKISSDALIGMLFTSSMALGVILLNLKQGYQPDLMSFLFGNILSISRNELLITLVLSAVILTFIGYYYRKIVFAFFDREASRLRGVNSELYEVLVYIFLSISVVLGVKIVGIILVSALLIIPVATAKLLALSMRQLLVFSIILAEITVIGGILLSALLNIPTGPFIVLLGAFFFFCTFVLSRIRIK